MKNQKPILNILRETENSDGTVDFEMEVTDELIERYKEITGKSKVTRRGLQNFLTKVIENSIMTEE